MTVGSERAANQLVGVLLPTTGGIVRIVGVKARPRLRTSYLALKGDFRPLKISGDYDRFVVGPLLAGLGEERIGKGPFELSLTGDIDTGRSWELPTLIAHLLAGSGRLVECPDGAASQADALGVAGPSAGATVVWATGKVDPDLGPQSDDYAIRQKCRLSRPLLAGLQARGHAFVIIVPDGLPDADRRELEAMAASVGAPMHAAANLADVCAALGLAPPERAGAGAAGPQASPGEGAEGGDAAGGATGSARDAGTVEPGRWSRRRLTFAGFGALAVIAALTAAVLSTSDRSGPSTDPGERNGGSGGANSMPQVQISRLHAESRNACIDRIMNSPPLQAAPISARDGRYPVAAGEGLCGIRVRNSASEQLSIGLSGELQPFAIQGDNALFRGADIAANDSVDLVFSRAPADIAATLTVRDGKGKEWRVAIEISPTTTAIGQ